MSRSLPCRGVGLISYYAFNKQNISAIANGTPFLNALAPDFIDIVQNWMSLSGEGKKQIHREIF